jgi:hypothetical protein
MVITWNSASAIKLASPASERYGLNSESSKMFDDLKFLWIMRDGECISRRYLLITFQWKIIRIYSFQKENRTLTAQ